MMERNAEKHYYTCSSLFFVDGMILYTWPYLINLKIRTTVGEEQ